MSYAAQSLGELEPWQMMWLIAFALFCLCKAASLYRIKVRSTALHQLTVYALMWPGLDPPQFLRQPIHSQPTWQEWIFSFLKCSAGIALLWWVIPHLSDFDAYIRGWVGLIGLAFLLHFGLFHIISCFWRTLGYDARPLMNWPITSASLTDFWSRRWNTAFRDLTHYFLFRPLATRLGPKPALLVGFLVSGIIHDLAISVPSVGGYGGPTAFFILQSLGILVERSKLGVSIGLGQGMCGWAFTAAFVILPAPLLFHPPFMQRVVVPFLHAVGAH